MIQTDPDSIRRALVSARNVVFVMLVITLSGFYDNTLAVVSLGINAFVWLSWLAHRVSLVREYDHYQEPSKEVSIDKN